MKKVLIVAYAFPPRRAIGAQRPYRLAKYFPKFGWEPIILTAKLPGKPPEGIRIIESDYKNIESTIKSKIGLDPDKGLHEQLGIPVTKNYKYQTLKGEMIKSLKEIIAFPDHHRCWYDFAVKTASEFLSQERVDAIISSSPPVTSHVIARKIKQEYKIPWIADLRDLWTQNHYYNKFKFIKYFERRLEIKTLSDADVLVTANPLVNVLRMLHKNKNILCITNGYDADDFPEIPVKLTDKFTITYTGILYNGKRDPSMLFKVLEQLMNEKKIAKELMEIRFFGPKEEWLLDEIKKYNLKGVVTVHGFIPREEALRMQRESQILLLLLWDNKGEEGILTGKVFEYLGAKRPIIAIGGGRSVVKELLETTNAGRFADTVETLKNVLLEYYQEFINSGEVKCNSNGSIKNYTYDSLTKKYSEILNELIVK